MLKSARRGLLALALCLTALLQLCGCAEESDSLKRVLDKQYITFGICPDMLPMSFSDKDSRPAGLSVDIAEALAAKLDIEARFSFVPPEEAVQALEEGDIDCYVNLPSPDIKTAALLTYVDSGLDYRQIIVACSDRSVNRLFDLRGRNVYAISGSDADSALQRAEVFASELGRYVRVEDMDALLEAMVTSSCDAIAADEPQLLYAIKERGIEYTISEDTIAVTDFIIAFRLRDETLCERMRLLYSGMLEDGSVEQIKSVWLDAGTAENGSQE